MSVTCHVCQYKERSKIEIQGAKIDATDKHGISPVLAAIWEGHTACVKYLLENVRLVIQ